MKQLLCLFFYTTMSSLINFRVYNINTEPFVYQNCCPGVSKIVVYPEDVAVNECTNFTAASARSDLFNIGECSWSLKNKLLQIVWHVDYHLDETYFGVVETNDTHSFIQYWNEGTTYDVVVLIGKNQAGI